MERTNRKTAIIAGGSFLLLVCLVLKGIPFLTGLISAFKNYNIVKGLLNSPNVGLANITETFSNLAFQKALLNTVKLNLLSLAATMVLAFLLAISIDRLDGLFQKIFLALILIPLFIPGSVLVHICFVWFKGTTVLASPQWFPFIYAVLITIKNVGIPMVFMLKTQQMREARVEQNGFERLIAPVVFVLIQFASILSSDMDIMQNILNPLVYETGDTLDHLIYRQGFMQMNIGMSQSIWLVQLVVHLVLGFTAYFILQQAVRRNPPTVRNSAGSFMGKIDKVNPAGFILPAIYALFLGWFVFKPLVIDGFSGIFANLPQIQQQLLLPYIRYILIYGLTALIGVPITVLLAKSAAMRGGFGNIARLILLFMMISGGMGIGQYLFIKSLGMVNTVFSIVLYYVFPVVNSLVLAAILSYHRDSSEWDGGADALFTWKNAFVLGILQFITMWNSEYVPLVFFSNRNAMPPVLLARMIAQGGAAGGPMAMDIVMGMDLIVCVLPVALFLVFRKHITEWVLFSYARYK